MTYDPRLHYGRAYLGAAKRSRAFTERFASSQATLSLSAIVVFSLIAFILSARTLYAALDDANYIEYFSSNTDWYGQLTSDSPDWWLLILGEPLWNSYTTVAGAALGPETAFRATIFVSAFAYLFFSAKLANGNWFVTTLLFLLHSDIGSQMYFNQVRQGVALSVFLALVSILRIRNVPVRMAVASSIAALVHSSFIVLVATVGIFVLKPRMRIVAPLAVAAVLFGSSRYVNLFDLVNAGRRAGLYANANILNMNFYIVTISAYAAAFYLLWPKAAEIKRSHWYFLTFGMASAAIAVTFVHEAGARLNYIAEAMICILVAKKVRTQNGVIAFGVWVFATLIFIISDYQHDEFLQASMIVRWQNILSWND